MVRRHNVLHTTSTNHCMNALQHNSQLRGRILARTFVMPRPHDLQSFLYSLDLTTLCPRHTLPTERWVAEEVPAAIRHVLAKIARFWHVLSQTHGGSLGQVSSPPLTDLLSMFLSLLLRSCRHAPLGLLHHLPELRSHKLRDRFLVATLESMAFFLSF